MRKKNMRLLSTLLLGVAGILPSTVTANGPLTSLSRIDNENGNICTSEVSLDCTYTDSFGRLQTCISEKAGDGEFIPWLYVPDENCSEGITATITMKMCNRNTRNIAIRPSVPESYFRFKGQDYSANDSEVAAAVRALNNPIAQGDCITLRKVQRLEKCKTYPMSVQLEGNMVGVAGNSYCYAFLFNKSRSKKIPDVIPQPPQTFTNTCREVSQLENGGQNVCNSEVSISCTYTDQFGQRRSCIGPNREFVFLNVREDQCDPNGIQATIFMEMCNKNAGNSGLSITNLLTDDSTYFRFKGRDYNNRVPNFGGDLAPQECRSFTTVETINTCKKSWPMSIQLEGNMTNAVEGNSYCYCYLFKEGRIEKFPDINPPPPRQPTLPPVPPPSTSVPLIIVECTDPTPLPGSNGLAPRYVKLLKAGPSNAPIINDLLLVVFENGPVWSTAIPVSNWSNNSPGPYYNICNFVQAGESGTVCDLITNPTNRITNQPGCYTLAIVSGNGSKYVIYDIFGTFGACKGTDADFSGGRATRKPSFTDPEDVWVPFQWDVVPGRQGPPPTPPTMPPIAAPSVPLIILEVTDPSQSPGSTPPRYVKLGKSGPSTSPIIDNLSLVVFDNGPVWSTAIPVSDSDWPSDSPGPDYYICNFVKGYETGSPCDLITNPNKTPITNQSGCYTLAIVSGGPNSVSYTIYDIFGIPGSCDGTSADFGGGKATRKPGFTSPEDVWVPTQWDVTPGRATPPPVPAVPLIITEVTDPVDGPNGVPPRYVRLLKSGPASAPLIDDMKLVVFENTPVWSTAIPVSDWPSDSPGPGYLICNFVKSYEAGAGCDLITNPKNPITNQPGCYTLAIVTGTQLAYNIYDIFGVVGVDCEGTEADFGGGKATRKPGFFQPEDIWVPYQWNVYPGVATPPPVPAVPLIITEVTDPVDGPYGTPPRYVKLKKSGPSTSPIIDDLKLVVFENGPVWSTAIPVSDLSPGPEYFICNYIAGVEFGSSVCNLVANPQITTITNQPGCYTLAIVSGAPNTAYKIYDIFGVVGVDCEGTDADFTGGSATRKPGFTQPEDVWVPDQWDVHPGRSTPPPTKQPTLPPTPALRYPAIITEITDPLDAPYGTPPRFVKIKTLGSPLQENLKLVVYENGPVWNTAIPISGLTPTNGDLFICNTIAAATSMSGLCNAISPAGNRITNEPGCYNLAIVRGDQSTFTPYYDVVDIFGINGAACSGTQSDFTGGYARRLPNFVTPRKVWFFPEWEVTKAGSTGGGDPLILYITEIADPADGIQNRFVELYSPNRMDYVITPEDNIILVRYTGSNSDPDPVPFLNLQGLRINEYGFLVLCVTDTCYGGKCQYALGVNSIANNPGNVDVALMRGPYPDGDNEIIDIYGVPGQAVLPSQDFSGGRAIRRSDAISPNNVCVADNWFVIPGGVFGGQTLLCTDTDPGCWSGVGDCQARQPPTPPPVPGPSPTSPSKAGKAGKAGKGITKVDSTSNHAPSKAGNKVNSTHRQPTGNVNSSPTNSSNMGPSKGKVNKRHRRTRRTTRKSM